ncbi:MAG TPA: 30S ribosomal protein S16 [Patescibacteria group bacterium]
MLTIRFARVGKKNRPQFKIMLQEHTIAPGGTHVEVLGSYDPRSKQAVLKEDRIKYWISQGVKVSDTAYNLFLKQGILTGEKRKVKIPAKKVEEVAAEASVATEVKAEIAETSKTEVTVPAAEVKTEEKPKEEKAPKDEAKPAEEAPKAEEKKEVIAEAPNEEAKSEEKPVEVAPVDKV